MWVFRFALLALMTAMLTLASAVDGATAANSTIDFESLSGPSLFCAPAAPTLTIGSATFSGGAILTAVEGLANQTTVYGTYFDCAGYDRTITITFSKPVSDFSVDVLNGTVSLSYTVASDLGGTVTKTLAASTNSGMDTFTLAETGITSVTISPTTPSDFWDFFIDNVRFTEAPTAPTAAAECKNGGWDTFGVFKNQGDCVSNVATGGRNEPDGAPQG
jgi:hypothetical protein